MPLVSGDGPNAQKATAKGKIIEPTSPGRFGKLGGSGGGGGGGGSSAEPNRFGGQPGKKLLPYEYFKEWTTQREIPAPSASQAKPTDIRGTLADSADIAAMMGGSTIAAPPGYDTPIPDEMKTETHRKLVEKGARNSYKMTWEDYQALTDRQRGAVDLNTMLVKARQQDLKSQDQYAKLDDTTKATYDKAVRRMFGEEGGSDTYAPRTMAELRRINFDGKAVGADLDQFLSLELAIDTQDLGQFKVDSKDTGPAAGMMAGVGAGMPKGSAYKIQDAMLDGMRDLTETLAKGNQMLQGFQQTMKRDQGVRDDLLHLGGIKAEPAVMAPGFRPGAAKPGDDMTIDDYFRQTLETLSLRDSDFQTSLANLNATLKPEELQLFGNYVDSVTRNAQMYDGDQKVGNKRYRSAAELRALVGLDKGE